MLIDLTVCIPRKTDDAVPTYPSKNLGEVGEMSEIFWSRGRETNWVKCSRSAASSIRVPYPYANFASRSMSVSVRVASNTPFIPSRASDKETLVSRLMDRPLRPAMHPGWFHETQLLSWVLSYDQKHPPIPLAITAASAALALSPVPLVRAVGGVTVRRQTR